MSWVFREIDDDKPQIDVGLPIHNPVNDSLLELWIDVLLNESDFQSLTLPPESRGIHQAALFARRVIRPLFSKSDIAEEIVHDCFPVCEPGKEYAL
jgi:hypothetical protein